MKRFGFIIFVLSGFLLSCTHSPVVHNPPTVLVDTHDTSGFYQNGDTIRMDIHLSDEDALHESSILVIAPDTGAAAGNQPDTMFFYQPYVHDLPSYALDTFWVVSGVSSLVDGFLTVTASNHHDGFTERDIPITVFP